MYWKWRKAKGRNEINTLNHLISSELFNFSSIIINQKASENKHNELRVFCVFLLSRLLASKRNEAWKNWLDMKHNEIHVQSVCARFTERENLLWDENFVSFSAFSLLKGEKNCWEKNSWDISPQKHWNIYYHFCILFNDTTQPFYVMIQYTEEFFWLSQKY